MLDPLEKELLLLCIMQEPFYHLLNEMHQPKPIVVDVLKGLIVKDLVFVLEESGSGKLTRTYSFDGDRIELYHFCASAKGLERLNLM